MKPLTTFSSSRLVSAGVIPVEISAGADGSTSEGATERSALDLEQPAATNRDAASNKVIPKRPMDEPASFRTSSRNSRKRTGCIPVHYSFPIGFSQKECASGAQTLLGRAKLYPPQACPKTLILQWKMSFSAIQMSSGPPTLWASLAHFCAAKNERVKGIEPSWPAWKAGALPLSYTRMNLDKFTLLRTPVKILKYSPLQNGATFAGLEEFFACDGCTKSWMRFKINQLPRNAVAGAPGHTRVVLPETTLEITAVSFVQLAG